MKKDLRNFSSVFAAGVVLHAFLSFSCYYGRPGEANGKVHLDSAFGTPGLLGLGCYLVSACSLGRVAG